MSTYNLYQMTSTETAKYARAAGINIVPVTPLHEFNYIHFSVGDKSNFCLLKISLKLWTPSKSASSQAVTQLADSFTT